MSVLQVSLRAFTFILLEFKNQLHLLWRVRQEPIRNIVTACDGHTALCENENESLAWMN